MSWLPIPVVHAGVYRVALVELDQVGQPRPPSPPLNSRVSQGSSPLLFRDRINLRAMLAWVYGCGRRDGSVHTPAHNLTSAIAIAPSHYILQMSSFALSRKASQAPVQKVTNRIVSLLPRGNLPSPHKLLLTPFSWHYSRTGIQVAHRQGVRGDGGQLPARQRQARVPERLPARWVEMPQCLTTARALLFWTGGSRPGHGICLGF